MLRKLIHDMLKLLKLMSSKRRISLVTLAAMMLLGAAGQTISISLVLPFTSLALRPERLNDNAQVEQLVSLLGVTDSRAALFLIGLAVLFSIIATNIITWLVLRGSSELVWGVNTDLSERLLATYLAQPYVFHTEHNSSKFMQNVLSEMQNVSAGILLPMIELVTRTILVCSILSLLIYISPAVTVIGGLTLGGFYGIVFRLTQLRLRENGAERVKVQVERFTSAMEAFGSIRETKLLNREQSFLKRYARATKDFCRINKEEAMLGQFPRLLAEAIVFSCLISLMLIYVNRDIDATEFIPTLTLFTLAAYRLIPAAQQLYSSAAQIQSNQPTLAHLMVDMDLSKCSHEPLHPPADVIQLPFQQSLKLTNISFTYPTRKNKVLNKLSLTITKGQSVAFCGKTGSGKTSLVDLIMGFYVPESGDVVIDNCRLDKTNTKQWQKNFGYVPQSIFLLDADIYRNVAFGIDDEKIDFSRVEQVCEQTCINQYIRDSLPEGYRTNLGERGVRLSGGQKQRLGLARALYRNPPILVLDEATSALDNETERAVMQAVFKAAEDRTTIIIAHRLASIKQCDKVFFLENGQILCEGTYDELINTCPNFEKLSRENSISEN